MTKSQEIQKLISFIDSLPSDSYLRHWLDSVFEEIRTDISNDIFPTATPAQSRALCIEIESRAKKNAQEILDRAKAQAEAFIADEKRKTENERARFEREKYAFRRALNELEKAF